MSDPTITVAAPPTTAGAASQLLALMAALSGTLTDYNTGSQIRTQSEAIGSVVEQQGIWAQAEAFQALVYSAMSLFGITAGQAVAASGVVTFSTSSAGTPPPATQNVSIPAGTIVQTTGGIQFQTTTAATLSAGLGSINIPVTAVVAGAAGNVPAGAINTIISGLTYPLYVTNAAATANGADAQSAAQSLALFASQVAAIGLSSPVAIANAAIGVNYGAESVVYSSLYEPWITAGAGAGSGTAGWDLYIDNGTGTASSGLIAAVVSKLTGGTVSGASNASGAIGYRDAGVPYNVYAVTPTTANVAVSATVVSGTGLVALVSGAIATAVSGYFTLPFGAQAEQSQISAAISNAILGNITALTVALTYASGGGSVDAVTTSPSGRVILGTLTQTLSQ